MRQTKLSKFKTFFTIKDPIMRIKHKLSHILMMGIENGTASQKGSLSPFVSIFFFSSAEYDTHYQSALPPSYTFNLSISCKAKYEIPYKT